MRWLHLSGSCVNSSEKSIFFMHFCKSCTHNGDRLILLIKTGNAYKEKMSRAIVNTFKNCRRKKQEVKTESKMVVAAK